MLFRWKIALIAGIPAITIFIIVAIVIFVRACDCCKKKKPAATLQRHVHSESSISHVYSRHVGHSHGKLFTSFRIKKDPVESALKHSNRIASVWRMAYPIKPFVWNEHPALIAEAVEHGWSAFAFTYKSSTCLMPASIWDMCTSSSRRSECDPEISWDTSHGTEYIQKLWLNPGGGSLRKENSISQIQALQASLPLPGPALESHPFPQEGYFEITVVAESMADGSNSNSSLAENEHVKLIAKDGKHMQAVEYPKDDKNESVVKIVVSSSEGSCGLSSNVEFSNFSAKDNHVGQDMDNLQIVAIGLAAGGAPPFRFPGSDVGSVGFYSNGRVYLNGNLHVEHEPKLPAVKRAWGVVNMTVGCGFDPRRRRVYFTVDGECVYELTTSSSEFGNPLYPTVAANYDVTLLANFGQSPFEYTSANGQRVPDPCFRHHLSKSMKNSLLNEDSGDLFSMGRIDSQWFLEIGSPGTDELQHRHVLSEAESDLFEIVLDARS